MHFCSGRPGAVPGYLYEPGDGGIFAELRWGSLDGSCRRPAPWLAKKTKKRVEARLKLRSRLLSPALWGPAGRAAGWLAGLW